MSKLISISDEIYGSLTKMKKDESYSQIIKKLLENRTNKQSILTFFGKGGLDKDKIKELNKAWSKWSEKYA